MRKVRITKLPQAQAGGFTGNNLNKEISTMGGARMTNNSDNVSTRDTLQAVPRNQANLEAEKGETAFGDINGDGMAEHMKIGGKKHSKGGTPLNLPDNTFIYSDTASMKIRDKEVLKMFGKTSGSYTPAQLAKQYDVNKYRKILEDKKSDKKDIATAESMIKNYNSKLGALALAQESKKGFPQGIPAAARPYMDEMGLKDEDILPEELQMQKQQMQEGFNPMMSAEMAYGGELRKAVLGEETIDPYGNAKTNAGNRTPTNKANQFNTRYENVKSYTDTYEGVIPGLANMSNADAQKAIYQWNLKNNSEGVKNMWSTFGLTNAGKKNKALSALTTNGVFNEGVLDNAENLALLEKAYADGFFGARTIDFKDPKQAAAALEEIKTKTTDPRQTSETDPIVPAVPRDPAQPWLQDRLSRANAFVDYMNVDKALPWSPRVNPEQIDPTFYDPTRELAQQSEQANLIMQGLGQFSGPQSISAQASQIQGNAAKNAANTLGRYNNNNVDIANQNNAQNAGIRNNAQLQNAAIAKQLYDQNVIANQQFRNSKSATRGNLVKAQNNLISNMWKTDAMNQMYPQYAVDPTVGGAMNFTKGKDFDGQTIASFDELVSKYTGAPYYMKGEAAVKAAQAAMGIPTDSSPSNPETVLAQYSKEGGELDPMFEMGASAFPFYAFY